MPSANATRQSGKEAKQPSSRNPSFKQTRALRTRENLLDAAGILLAEIGIDRISTNLICARAGVTPPAFYYNFEDKYAVIEALGCRLLERQGAVLKHWLACHASSNSPSYNFDKLVLELIRVIEAEPGGVWISRALHAMPKLIHVRLTMHRSITDNIANACRASCPDLSRDILWRRVRLMVEFGYIAGELVTEEDRIPRSDIIAEAARLLRWMSRGNVLADYPAKTGGLRCAQGRASLCDASKIAP
jgi:AcrR family transcriptional regulator